MIVLPTTSDLLEVTVGPAASALQVTSQFRDVTTSAYTPGRQLASAAVATTTTVVSSPAASTYRLIDNLVAYNPNTYAVAATVLLDNGTNSYPVWKGSIPALGRLQYTDQTGFVALGAAGIPTQLAEMEGPAQSSFNAVFLKEEITLSYNKSAGTSNIYYMYPQGMQFFVPRGTTYYLKAAFNIESPATTTGLMLISNISPSTLIGTTDELVMAGAAWNYKASSTTAETPGYSTGLFNANPTDTGVAAARAGENILQGEQCGTGPLDCDSLVSVGFGGEYLASTTLKLKPGSFIQWAIGPQWT